MVWNLENVYGHCVYWSLVWKLLSLCLWHMFNTNVQRMHEIGVELLHVLEALYKQVAVGSTKPFGLWRINGKNCKNFLLGFFVTYLWCVITKINESQRISACYVKHVLFNLEKTKPKGSFDPFEPFRDKQQ